MPVAMMSRVPLELMSNGNLKNRIFWPLCTRNLVVPHCRYLSAKVIHSCGTTANASVISAKTPTAPAMHSAQVAGRLGLGRRIRAATMIRPMIKRLTPQISRPAGRIHGNQSGIRLGIGPVVLREAQGWWDERQSVSYHAI